MWFSKSARPSTATRHRRETVTVDGIQAAPSLMQETRALFDEVERTESLVERDKWVEARWRICALADAKEKEWASTVERVSEWKQ